MAISAADIAALPTYTNAELKILYRWGLANNAAGTTRMISTGAGSRSITFPSVSDMLEVLEWVEEQVQNEATESPGGLALVRFGEEV